MAEEPATASVDQTATSSVDQTADTAADQLDWRAYDPLRLPPILDAALAAFAEHGYHGTSVRDIARRVGQTVPAIYYHYENKQALLMTLLQASLDEVRLRCHRANEEAGEDPVERFTLLVTCVVLYIAHRRELTFLEGEIRSLEPENRAVCVAKRDEIEALVVAAIEDAATAGRFTTPYPREAARAVLAMCNGVATWYRADGPLTPEDLTTRYVTFAHGVVGAR